MGNFQTERFLKTLLKEKTPSEVGLFGCDELDEGNSGGTEFLPIKLFNIRPATQKTFAFRDLDPVELLPVPPTDVEEEEAIISGLLKSLTPWKL